MHQFPGKGDDYGIGMYSPDSFSDVYDLMHPGWPFLKSSAEREVLVALLAGTMRSFSLDRFEKMRIMQTVLSRFQISELLDVFKDEVAEFRKLMNTEKEAVYDLMVKAYHDWRDYLLPELVIGPKDPGDMDKMLLLNALMSADPEDVRI